jgi:hypothetical protein
VKQILCCAACGATLTPALTVVSSKTPGVILREHEDGKPLTPRGSVFKSWEPIERSYGDEPALLEFAPQYWLNPEDLDGEVRNTPDVRRLNGCCGLDGCDGPNQVCQCGADVGTLRTDCWTPLVFIPDPGSINWIEEQ